MGAEKVFAIGVRCGKKGGREEIADGGNPSLAQVMGVVFDVMFLDHLDTSCSWNTARRSGERS